MTRSRDGTQGEGVSFSVADKLRVAEKFDSFGVYYVEGGWRGNPKDIEFLGAAKASGNMLKLPLSGPPAEKD